MADPQHATDEGCAATYYDLPSTGLRKEGCVPVCVDGQATRILSYEFSHRDQTIAEREQVATLYLDWQAVRSGACKHPFADTAVSDHKVGWVAPLGVAGKGNENLLNAKPNLVLARVGRTFHSRSTASLEDTV